TSRSIKGSRRPRSSRSRSTTEQSASLRQRRRRLLHPRARAMDPEHDDALAPRVQRVGVVAGRDVAADAVAELVVAVVVPRARALEALAGVAEARAVPGALRQRIFGRLGELVGRL